MRLLWWLPTALVLGLMAIGAGGAYTRALGPGPGFRLFFLAILLALSSALLLSGAAVLAGARGWSWRRSAVRSAAVPVIVTLVVVLLGITTGSHPIHDVTTHRSVGFAADVRALWPDEDRKPVLAQQSELYPDIEPRLVALPRGDAYAIALRVAKEMPGWTVTDTAPRWGRINAIAVSRIFGFIDDVAIIVEGRGRGDSLVQIRSRSRIGESDLGANAARIRAYLDAVSAAAG